LKGELKMSQISKVRDALGRRYKKFQDKQEIHLCDKEFKEFANELNVRRFDGSKVEINTPILYQTSFGSAIIKNRDKTPNFAEREMY
jgi:hypothetical protein